MREIKFRAWNEDAKKMVDLQKITPLALAMDPAIVGARMGVYIPDADRVIVMQFTGLKDKNGVDVYEGDVLSLGGEQFKIVWVDSLAQFLGDYGDSDFAISEYMIEILNIIGNIYENPDWAAREKP